MADLLVKAVMTADQSGLVSGAQEASEALDRMKTAHTDLSAAAKEAANDLDGAGLSTYQLSRALEEIGTPMGARVLGMRELTRGAHELIEGLGLLNTAALALGVAFVAEISHTVLFQSALHSLWGTLEEGVSWFDKLISGKMRWDAAQASGAAASFDPDAESNKLLGDLAHIDTAMQDHFAPRTGVGSQWGGADRPNVGWNPAAYDQMGRARAAILDKLYPSLAVTPSRFGSGAPGTGNDYGLGHDYFLPGYGINDMVRDPATGMWVSSSNVLGSQGFASQWSNEQTGMALRNLPAISGITPWNTQGEQAWASVGAGGATMAGASQQINDTRTMTEQMQKLWDDYYSKQAEDLQQSLDKMQAEETATMDKLRGDFDQLGTSLSTNFKDAGKDVETFLMQLAKMAIQLEVMQPLTSSLFGDKGTPGGGLFGSAISGFIGGLSGSTIPDYVPVTPSMITGEFHTGGIIGVDGMSRFIHPAYWDNAPRFHSGGIAGNEVPIVAQQGEGVFTPAQMAALGARSSPNVSLTINNATGSQARVQQNTDANGNVDLTVMMDQIDYAMADYVYRGKSQTARMLQSVFGLTRTPASV